MPTERIQTIITTKGAKESASSFGDMALNVIGLNQGLDLLTKVLDVVGSALGSVIEEGMNFNAQMSGVRAVTKTTAQEFAALEAEARRLGGSTVFTAIEAGQAMEELGRAGQSVTQIIETTGAA